MYTQNLYLVFLCSGDESKKLLTFHFPTIIWEYFYLLGKHLDISRVRKVFHDIDIRRSVRIILDLLNVTYGETIEKIHDDDHHQK